MQENEPKIPDGASETQKKAIWTCTAAKTPRKARAEKVADLQTKTPTLRTTKVMNTVLPAAKTAKFYFSKPEK